MLFVLQAGWLSRGLNLKIFGTMVMYCLSTYCAAGFVLLVWYQLASQSFIDAHFPLVISLVLLTSWVFGAFIYLD